MDDFEKRWQRLRDQLGAEARGDSQPRLCSQRTLFGIRSGVEQALDAVVAEQEAQARRKLEAERQRRQAGVRGVEGTRNAEGELGVRDVSEAATDGEGR